MSGMAARRLSQVRHVEGVGGQAGHLRSWGVGRQGTTGPQLCAWAKETQAQKESAALLPPVSSLVSSLCILC
jgi:hypothetical protein